MHFFPASHSQQSRIVEGVNPRKMVARADTGGVAHPPLNMMDEWLTQQSVLCKCIINADVPS